MLDTVQHPDRHADGSGRTIAITTLALGAVIGLAYLARRRRHGARDDEALAQSALLAAADGGYDASAVATPATTDLR